MEVYVGEIERPGRRGLDEEFLGLLTPAGGDQVEPKNEERELALKTLHLIRVDRADEADVSLAAGVAHLVHWRRQGADKVGERTVKTSAILVSVFEPSTLL